MASGSSRAIVPIGPTKNRKVKKRVASAINRRTIAAETSVRVVATGVDVVIMTPTGNEALELYNFLRPARVTGLTSKGCGVAVQLKEQ
jgi:hypothetical protein